MAKETIEQRLKSALPTTSTQIKNFATITLWMRTNGDKISIIKTEPQSFGSTKRDGYRLMYTPVEGETIRSETLAEIVTVVNVSCRQLDGKTVNVVDNFAASIVSNIIIYVSQ